MKINFELKKVEFYYDTQDIYEIDVYYSCGGNDWMFIDFDRVYDDTKEGSFSLGKYTFRHSGAHPWLPPELLNHAISAIKEKHLKDSL